MRVNRQMFSEMDNTNKKQPIGSHDHRFGANNDILIVKWLHTHDISGMDYDIVEPLGKVQQHEKEIMGRDNLLQLKLLRTYNKVIGGSDKHDWFICKNCNSVISKKWYWLVFT